MESSKNKTQERLMPVNGGRSIGNGIRVSVEQTGEDTKDRSYSLMLPAFVKYYCEGH